MPNQKSEPGGLHPSGPECQFVPAEVANVPMYSSPTPPAEESPSGLRGSPPNARCLVSGAGDSSSGGGRAAVLAFLWVAEELGADRAPDRPLAHLLHSVVPFMRRTLQGTPSADLGDAHVLLSVLGLALVADRGGPEALERVRRGLRAACEEISGRPGGGA